MVGGRGGGLHKQVQEEERRRQQGGHRILGWARLGVGEDGKVPVVEEGEFLGAWVIRSPAPLARWQGLPRKTSHQAQSLRNSGGVNT